MKLAIHNQKIEPFVDASNGDEIILHLSTDVSIEQFNEKSDLLGEDQKAELLELWFDEKIQRNYVRRDYGVEISKKL